MWEERSLGESQEIHVGGVKRQGRKCKKIHTMLFSEIVWRRIRANIEA